MSVKDAYYGGDLVNGSRQLDLFGDVGTELMIKHDGDEGLLKIYKEVEFFAPVYVGDFIEAEGEIVKVGNTSRIMEFKSWKVAESLKDPNNPSSAKVVDPPTLICSATGVAVVTKDKQRINHSE
ncbi:3-aminobutyryl-CoA ammonia lyase [Bacillus sp. FJAT-49731]|nr:3-aminobutyryl-CoA ammonia lyase [Lederbergia citrea]